MTVAGEDTGIWKGVGSAKFLFDHAHFAIATIRKSFTNPELEGGSSEPNEPPPWIRHWVATIQATEASALVKITRHGRGRVQWSRVCSSTGTPLRYTFAITGVVALWAWSSRSNENSIYATVRATLRKWYFHSVHPSPLSVSGRNMGLSNILLIKISGLSYRLRQM